MHQRVRSFSRVIVGTLAAILALTAVAPAQTTPALTAVAPAQTAPNLNDISPYKKEYNVVGGLRIAGNDLKGNIELLMAAFQKYHPQAAVSGNFMTSSEGALGMMYAGVSDIAPMGDDAKITDQMPFYNSFGYTPTELSIATGGYDQRGTLFAWAIVVNAANPIAKLSKSQLDRIFGAERSGAWSVGDNPEHDILFTAKYARGAETNIRTWGQLGLGGEWQNKEIQTYGYVAPGFAVNFERQVMHWSDKWNPNFKEFVEDKEATSNADGRRVVADRMMEALQKDKDGIAWTSLIPLSLNEASASRPVRSLATVSSCAVSKPSGAPEATRCPCE